jgi:hypothetical protein
VTFSGLTFSGGVLTASAATPGGTSGQIQYNNSGALGGFTASGDATINTATGAVTLATVNSNVGTFGSSAAAPVVTVNAKGLVTAVTTAAITGTISGSGGLIGVRVFTTPGATTYTPTSGTNWVIVELVGGGGGGGGVASPGGTSAYLASGGQAGGWLRVKLTANFSGASYTVGAKGSGGAAGANDGGVGTNTTFTTTAGSPVTYTAKGGVGGTRNGAFAPPFAVGLPIPRITTDGDVAKSGELGAAGFTLSLSNTVGGSGANGPYGYGGGAIFLGSNNTSVVGAAAGGAGGGRRRRSRQRNRNSASWRRWLGRSRSDLGVQLGLKPDVAAPGGVTPIDSLRGRRGPEAVGLGESVNGRNGREHAAAIQLVCHQHRPNQSSYGHHPADLQGASSAGAGSSSATVNRLKAANTAQRPTSVATSDSGMSHTKLSARSHACRR